MYFKSIVSIIIEQSISFVPFPPHYFCFLSSLETIEMLQGFHRRIGQRSFGRRLHSTHSSSTIKTKQTQTVGKSPRKSESSRPNSSASARNPKKEDKQNQINDIPKAFAIGTLAGTMGSLAGMGGGFVMIPLLTGICRLSQHQAHGTSLAAVMATGIAGAVSYHDHVDYEAVGPIAATAVFTASLGARTTTFLSETWLKRALGVLLLVMGPAVPAKEYIVERYSNSNQQHEEDEEAKSQKDAPLYPKWVVPASIGLCSGYLAGLFGVGGGTLVVPALIFSQPKDAPYTHHQALATSLAAMVLPALVGTLTHAKAGNVAFRVAPPLAIGALVGAYGGGKMALGTEESTLQWGFSVLLVLLGGRTLQKTF